MVYCQELTYGLVFFKGMQLDRKVINMYVTRTTLKDIQSKLDELEFIESKVVNTVCPIANFKTNLNNKYTTEINGVDYELTEDARNQALGIGKFGVKSFKDAERVSIPVQDMTTKLNAGIFMLNSVKDFADKPKYKHQFYENKNVSITNPSHPNLEGVRLFKEVFDQIGQLGLTPRVYNLDYDPISGRQSCEFVFDENVSRANIRINDTMATGIKITNNTNGHGYFKVQIYAVQLVCTNGMIAPVTVEGFAGIHRSKWDLLSKIAIWLNSITGQYYNFREFNDQLYSDLAYGIIELAKKTSSTIKTALERAMTVSLGGETPLKIFEKLAKKESAITKKDVDHLVSIYYSDPTIDRENPSMLNIVQSISRHANSIDSPSKREELQELSYIIATR